MPLTSESAITPQSLVSVGRLRMSKSATLSAKTGTLISREELWATSGGLQRTSKQSRLSYSIPRCAAWHARGCGAGVAARCVSFAAGEHGVGCQPGGSTTPRHRGRRAQPVPVRPALHRYCLAFSRRLMRPFGLNTGLTRLQVQRRRRCRLRIGRLYRRLHRLPHKLGLSAAVLPSQHSRRVLRRRLEHGVCWQHWQFSSRPLRHRRSPGAQQRGCRHPHHRRKAVHQHRRPRAVVLECPAARAR